ncbi:MAG: lamin tail domain-containing protein [Candidatus Stahlbacteria bacterium]|nr:lamin tail domain-containing protein [Candidatus Stahlbacteria bacterium]
MCRTIRLFVISILITVGGCRDNPAGAEESPLKGILFINEFLASNRSVNADEQGDYEDWIELYNAGEIDVNLGGMYLTDNFTQCARWIIPDTVIPAGGFLLFWADNEVTEGPLHTNFKLNASNGEELGLYDREVQGLLLIDSISFNTQQRDTSYGHYPDGKNSWQFFSTPTPGKANKGRRGR